VIGRSFLGILEDYGFFLFVTKHGQFVPKLSFAILGLTIVASGEGSLCELLFD